MTKLPVSWDPDGTYLYKIADDRYVIERPGEMPYMLGWKEAGEWSRAKWPDRIIAEFEEEPESFDDGWSEIGEVIPLKR